jgi:hypothetical protein
MKSEAIHRCKMITSKQSKEVFMIEQEFQKLNHKKIV